MEFFGAEFIMAGSAWTMWNENPEADILKYNKRIQGLLQNCNSPLFLFLTYPC